MLKTKKRLDLEQKYAQKYLSTQYTPEIMLKILSEKPSACKLLYYFAKSVNSSGLLVMSPKQMSKVLHIEIHTVYSAIDYLIRNGYIAIGSTGGNVHNVYVVNPSIFWFPDAIYNYKKYNAFPSAVILGRQRNRKFYKSVRNFAKQAQSNMTRDPIFAERVDKIIHDKKRKILLVRVKQNYDPVEQALYSVMYLGLKKKSLNVVKYVFSHLKLSSLGIFYATNKDIYNGMVKNNISGSIATVNRTMAKLTRNHVIVRHKNMIMFGRSVYRNKREHHIKANNIRHLRIQRKDKEKKLAKKQKIHITRIKLRKIKDNKSKEDEEKGHLQQILEEQQNRKM